MKQLLTVALMALLATSAFAQKVVHTNRYAADNKALGVSSGPRVVLMGDSITDGWPGQRPDFFRTTGFVGRGISGEVTAQMLLRFRADVIDPGASTVVILGGINDIAENLGDRYSEDNTFDNIKSMVELAKAHNIRVILCALLPSTHFTWRPEAENVQAKVAGLNARIRAYAKANGIDYADYYSAMAGADGITIREDLSGDSVHPNAKGYEIMEKVLLEVLNK